MEKQSARNMELLAPAGTIEAFEAAVESGADAIYIGAPAFNARALARHFSLAEVAAMIDHAHKNRVKVYLAMNSLMKEGEIGKAVEELAALEALKADALIIQDLGISYLARKFFPGLRLHASTLMGAHNSLNVRQFAEMGFQRVVLAREMTLSEIGKIHNACPVELEVFVHGALCFAYSGLCLFSSYLGGKSGLRGRCVQPCRRRYTWGSKGRGPGAPAGYLFSMNDLAGLELIPQLRQAGVSSLKIEGRMRSPQYVASVVKAYRLALDNPATPAVLAEAKELLEQAMGRKASFGYFKKAQPADIIAPQHSGNIGLFLGKIEKVTANRAQMTLKEPLRTGDRLRIHQEGSGDRQGFTLKGLWQGKVPLDTAKAGSKVQLDLPPGAKWGDSLYKVDLGERRQQAAKKGIQPGLFSKKVAKLVDPRKLAQIAHFLGKPVNRPAVGKGREERPVRGQVQNPGQVQGRRGVPQVQLPLEWWLKIDDFESLKVQMPTPPSRLVITLSRQTFSQYSRQQKRLTPYRRRLVWALPPVILEDDLSFYREAIEHLRRSGYNAWQIGHIGQRLLFAQAHQEVPGEPGGGTHPPGRKKGRGIQASSERLLLFGDYTLNVLNSMSVQALAGLGLGNVQLAIETDRQNLFDLLGHKNTLPVGMTIYGLPPLFTARLASSFFKYDQPLISPKGEVIVLKQCWGQTVAVAAEPFSLLPHSVELAARGVAFGVVDLSHMRPRPDELVGVFRQSGQPGRGGHRLRTFNYTGTLL
ncbi:peptidase U32 family protein [Thiovibrio frasassiensis]|uniref:U32 family peptidase n=1 Tax=Thiovibrio frasassiensis TaxID=2984131 RepID=A0A9X4MIC5_9BACT|nr:peptidase U32 family protein [Thiovibrio frasassiensis]MDG4476898.1 U32 family peptidase [Thiovibrio frasassiensis]